jgi:hypothetical protein
MGGRGAKSYDGEKAWSSIISQNTDILRRVGGGGSVHTITLPATEQSRKNGNLTVKLIRKFSSIDSLTKEGVMAVILRGSLYTGLFIDRD